jgi:hypothetical protein
MATTLHTLSTTSTNPTTLNTTTTLTITPLHPSIEGTTQLTQIHWDLAINGETAATAKDEDHALALRAFWINLF